MIGPYQTPQAFRVALETRLAALSQEQGTDLQRLRRRVAFAATFASRDTHPVPISLPVPPPSWSLSYAALAEDLKLSAYTLMAAYDLVEAYWQEHQLGLRE